MQRTAQGLCLGLSAVKLEMMAGGWGRGGVGIERGKGVCMKEERMEKRVKERKRVVRFMYEEAGIMRGGVRLGTKRVPQTTHPQ